MSKNLALFTFGIFVAPAEDPKNADFHALNDRILALVDRSEGFISRSGYDDEPGPAPWGPQIYPHFYEEKGDGWSPATLSLWTGLAPAMAFTYHGIHNQALVRGREWFRSPQWPPLTLWWVAEDETPTWQDAVARHLTLHENGPGPDAFTFRQAFDPEGALARIDRAAIRAIAQRNQARVA